MKVLAGVPARGVTRPASGAGAWLVGRALAAVAGALLLLAGGALSAPAAGASPRTVCCFRITLKVSGSAFGHYKKFQENANEGDYQYSWDGVAYGIAHLQSDVLVTDRGVGAGDLLERNDVVDYAGRPADREECSGGSHEAQGSYNGFVKTRYRFPDVGLGHTGWADFGRPFHSWELDCASLATNVLSDLNQAGSFPNGVFGWWAPREFFDNHHLWYSQGSAYSGLSARKLRKGGSQEGMCVLHQKSNKAYMDATGVSAILINVVHFPPDDLKRQQRRLSGFLGKSGTPEEDKGPIANLRQDWADGKRIPKNGCEKG
jgi:hypothetical protein